MGLPVELASSMGLSGADMSRAYWILLVLTLANLVNVMDRTLLTVLIQPIKTDLHLSDTQLGLLLGASFAVVYSLAGLPLARLADRGLHRRVLVGSVLVWSAMTSLSGLAQSFWQFAGARVGVAAGEAGLLPAGYGLISKLFPAQRRGLAVAVFALGLPLGAALGASFAPRLAEQIGWRGVFMVVGPLSLLLLPMFFLAFPKVDAADPPSRSNFLADAKRLLSSRAYRNLWIGHAVATLFGYSLGGFFVAFMMRTHGLSAKQAGLVVAVSSVTTGVAGIVAGGILHDIAAKGRPGRGLYPAIGALILSSACAAWGLLAEATTLAVALIVAAKFLYGAITAPTYASALSLSAPELRATSSALIGLSTSLIGATFGPLIAGALSDLLHPWAGDSALRYALLCAPVFEIVGAVLLWRAARSAGRERPVAYADGLEAPAA